MDLYLKRRGSCIISEADDNSQLRKHEQGNCPITADIVKFVHQRNVYSTSAEYTWFFFFFLDKIAWIVICMQWSVGSHKVNKIVTHINCNFASGMWNFFPIHFGYNVYFKFWLVWKNWIIPHFFIYIPTEILCFVNVTMQNMIKSISIRKCYSILFYHSKNYFINYTISFYNTSSISDFYFPILLIKIIYLHNKIIFP